jgi:DNA replication protein DnaC
MDCTICRGRMYVFSRQGDRATAQICSCSKVCRRCQGAGFIYVTREETFSQKVGPRRYEVLAQCPCKILQARVQRFCEAGVPAVLAGKGFEGYGASNEAQDRALKASTAFAMGFSKQAPPKGFVLSGPVGTGKTHLLASTLTHLLLEAGVEAKYVEISLLYATIRRGFQDGKSGGEIIGPLSEVEVLAIDELGKGRGSQFELETLDELIARRYNSGSGKTTLFATNYSLAPERRSVKSAAPNGYRSSDENQKASRDADLLRERVGERIYSRLCEMCEFVELPPETPDHRRTRHEIEASPTGSRNRFAAR